MNLKHYLTFCFLWDCRSAQGQQEGDGQDKQQDEEEEEDDKHEVKERQELALPRHFM
jgi:hypothetical protein